MRDEYAHFTAGETEVGRSDLSKQIIGEHSGSNSEVGGTKAPTQHHQPESSLQ